MLRRLGLLLMGGALLLPAILSGCAAQADLTLKQIVRSEGFNLSGHSERSLRSILTVFRELDSEDRPQ